MQVFSQNDPQWKNDKIGFDTGPTDTIGNYGCYMTAIANVCSWAGNDLTPLQINNLCKQNNWLVSSDLVAADDIPAKLCSNLRFVEKRTWHDATSMNYFADASDPNVAYIICIDASQAPGIQTHFVMVWATLGANDLEIDDSWDGVRKPLSHYGNPSVIIQSATKFIKVQSPAPTPPVPPVVVVETPAPTPQPTPYVAPSAPVTGIRAEKYTLVTTLPYFASASDAQFDRSAISIIKEGEYFVFAKVGNYWNLSTDNVKDQNKWVDVRSNVLTSLTAGIDITAPEDWQSTYKPFADGKSRKYKALSDMFILDLAGVDKNGGVQVHKGDMVPIFGSLNKNGMTYLIPWLNDVHGVPMKNRFYGIPTNDIYSGVPNLEGEIYRASLNRVEAENRAYRKSVGHETTDDRLYEVQQLLARAVKDGLRVLNGIVTMKQLKAITQGQKEDKK